VPGNLGHKRVIRIGVTQQGANAEKANTIKVIRWPIHQFNYKMEVDKKSINHNQKILPETPTRNIGKK
jgi:hypothetical protein